MISVVVPVYNTSEFLRDCLDSLLLQTYVDFEVICVNDGSTDNSLSILEKIIFMVLHLYSVDGIIHIYERR